MTSLNCNQTLTMSSGIYAIVHVSGKLYIGSALSLVRRHGEHQRMLRRGAHENNHLQKAWNCHGQQAFTFKVLFVCAATDLVYYEQRTLDYYKGKIGWRRMYNCNPAAQSRLGTKMSAKAHALLLERLKGNQYTKGHKLSPEHRAKIGVATTRRNLGSKMSEETKRKIGDANRGRVVSVETRAKISVAGKGRKLTDEHKAALAKSPKMRGKHHSDESKAKISLALKDRVFSNEHRAKISIGVRAWRESQRQARTEI